MKAVGLILFLNLIIINFIFAQASNHAVTVNTGTKLKRIPTCINDLCLPNQYFSIQADRDLHADEYFFENVAIGRIKYCKVRYAMKNDSTQKITIYLSGQKNYDGARKQAQKQFGHAFFDQNGMDETYTWTSHYKLKLVSISLHRQSNEWASEMIIQPRKPYPR